MMNTPPGPVEVQYQHMITIDEKGIHTVVIEFNASIHRSEIPEDWLHGYL